jgi:hypothetical protein
MITFYFEITLMADSHGCNVWKVRRVEERLGSRIVVCVHFLDYDCQSSDRHGNWIHFYPGSYFLRPCLKLPPAGSSRTKTKQTSVPKPAQGSFGVIRASLTIQSSVLQASRFVLRILMSLVFNDLEI